MFSHKLRATAMATIAVAAASAAAPAFADTVFETASAGTLGAPGVYPATGDGTDGNSNFIGATFTLTSTTGALQVGANMDGAGVGSVFFEVVPVASLSDLPNVTGSGSNALVSWLQSNTLGNALLNAPTTAGDASTVIHFTSALAPGSYALIVGGGLFGSKGVPSPFDSSINPAAADLTDSGNGNVTNGTQNVFASFYGDSFSTYGYDSGVRLFANTAPVPLPAALPLMVSGLAGLGFLRRRRPVRPAQG